VAERADVVVVGAGQAGLATSHHLRALGVEHVVLERDQVGAGWAGRWDSFTLVTPTHTVRLPGARPPDGDPHGYLPRDAVVAHLVAYAQGAPVRLGADVQDVRYDDGTWHVDTTAGQFDARAVVLATGAYPSPHLPAAVADAARHVPVVPSTAYRSLVSLPDGPVLVVGSGQSGCQLAEELALAGRDVVLACGRAPWIPRRLDGRDTFDWLLDAGFFHAPRASLPGPAALLLANPQATGARGGHDLHYRTLAALGVRLVGRLAAVDDGTALFAPDLPDSVAWGDARWADLTSLITAGCAARGEAAPAFPAPGPVPVAAADRLPLSQVGSVLVTSGYRPDYSGFVPYPEAFDAQGFPVQLDGASTVLPGLSFVGVHFLRRRSSSLLMGVGDDAALVAGTIAAGLGRR
jgi:putative flavoprotein involved in K+ transport